MNYFSCVCACACRAKIWLYSCFLVGLVRSQISSQGAHCCNKIAFLCPRSQKKHRKVHPDSGVSVLALTLGIGFTCEHAEFCVPYAHAEIFMKSRELLKRPVGISAHSN